MYLLSRDVTDYFVVVLIILLYLISNKVVISFMNCKNLYYTAVKSQKVVIQLLIFQVPAFRLHSSTIWAIQYHQINLSLFN